MNQAIAAHDLAGIATAWMPDVHVVSSTSAQTAGRDANRERMSQQFTRRPDTVYVRKPITIDVFDAWAVASERGEWTGRWTEPDGKLEIGGTYRRTAQGGWPVAHPGRAVRYRRAVRAARIAGSGRAERRAVPKFRGSGVARFRVLGCEVAGCGVPGCGVPGWGVPGWGVPGWGRA